jgi:CMP-N-acetylneuraminic acid synthetase
VLDGFYTNIVFGIFLLRGAVPMRQVSGLCVIPARGGSKGLPRKNIAEVAGKPLLAWSILTALQVKFINKIVVSTDDSEIGEVAKSYGAEVVWRPTAISDGFSSSELALLHTLNSLKNAGEICPELLVFMQCTSPLTRAIDVEEAITLLLDKDVDVVFSAVRTHALLWRAGSDNCAVAVNHDPQYRPMRQEMQPQFQETGAFYIMKTDGFKSAQKRFFGRVMLFETPASCSLDIDDKHDLDLAEHLLSDRFGTESAPTPTE